jgi:regulator of protease activity HflC (stomatin/prohibitin superfamily)
MSSSIVEVPVDDREIPFLFHGRTADFQEVNAQGVITYRVDDPERLAAHIDFTICLDKGGHLHEPVDQVATFLTQLAQEAALDYMGERSLRQLLADGAGDLRARIHQGLTQEESVQRTGLQVASVRIAAIRPTAELERALQTPALETFQQQADEATFQRRALAVEKERAIQENELQNQIELARKRELLIAQEGSNARQHATEEAGASRISTEANAENVRISSSAEAERIRMVEDARVGAEERRVLAYENASREALLGMAAKEFASKLTRIDHLNITPEMITPLLNQWLNTSQGQPAKAPGRGR